MKAKTPILNTDDAHLSFVTKDSYWHVPPTKDYRRACSAGKLYAIEFMKHLKRESLSAGMGFMMRIARDMAKIPGKSPMAGYAIGFFGEIEEALWYAAECSNLDAIEAKIAKRMKPAQRKAA